MLFSGFSFSHVQMINRLSEKDDGILESRKGLFFFPLVQLRKDYSIYNKLIFFWWSSLVTYMNGVQPQVWAFSFFYKEIFFVLPNQNSTVIKR